MEKIKLKEVINNFRISWKHTYEYYLRGIQINIPSYSHCKNLILTVFGIWCKFLWSSVSPLVKRVPADLRILQVPASCKNYVKQWIFFFFKNFNVSLFFLVTLKDL